MNSLNFSKSQTNHATHERILVHNLLSIRHHLEAVHSRCWIVSNIVANANATIEKLNSKMLVIAIAIVHKNAVLLCCAENYGNIGFRLRAQRLHFDKAVVVEESQRC